MQPSDSAVDQSWLEVHLPSGRTVLMHGVDGAAPANDDDAETVQDVRFRGFDFSTLTATLHEVSTLVKEAVRKAAPAEAEVELGLGLSAKTGQVLVLFGETAANASMKVTLKWRFDQRSNGADEA